MAKKSLDKDLMFSKIMPSSQPVVEIKNFENKSENLEDTLELPLGLESGVEDEIGKLKVRLFSRTDDWKEPGSSESTINVMENLVLEHLDEAIRKFNCCNCDHCRRDVAALALNKLPPKYVVAEPEHVMEMMDMVPAKMVFDALVQAIIKVRANPRH